MMKLELLMVVYSSCGLGQVLCLIIFVSACTGVPGESNKCYSLIVIYVILVQ